MKERRVGFRISERDYQFLQGNVPNDFDNLSEFLRSAALSLAKNPEILDPEFAVSYTESNLEEIKQDVVAEIQKNRSILLNLVHALEGRKAQESHQIKENLIEDLIKWYQSNKDLIRRFDDLYDLVSDPFLKEVIPETIQLLKRKGMISILASGKVTWNI